MTLQKVAERSLYDEYLTCYTTLTVPVVGLVIAGRSANLSSTHRVVSDLVALDPACRCRPLPMGPVERIRLSSPDDNGCLAI